MSLNDLSTDVKRLLAALGGIDTLEVLLLMEREPKRYWSAFQVAWELPLRQQIEPALERLAQLGLVDVRLGNNVLYRYLPASRELDATVRRLRLEYEERLFLVLESLVSGT